MGVMGLAARYFAATPCGRCWQSQAKQSYRARLLLHELEFPQAVSRCLRQQIAPYLRVGWFRSSPPVSPVG